MLDAEYDTSYAFWGIIGLTIYDISYHIRTKWNQLSDDKFFVNPLFGKYKKFPLTMQTMVLSMTFRIHAHITDTTSKLFVYTFLTNMMTMTNTKRFVKFIMRLKALSIKTLSACWVKPKENLNNLPSLLKN